MAEAIITTSWDDGHPLNIKVKELLKKYKIPATFYIPIRTRKRKTMNSKQIKEIARDFDIGGHTLNHVNLTDVGLKTAKKETPEGKRALEKIVGKELVSFSYPYGKFNDKIINIVKKVGFKCARTVSQFETKIKNPFKIGTTIHARQDTRGSYAYYIIKQFIKSGDIKFFYFAMKNKLFDMTWNKIAIETLKFVVENGGIWHLWGHSCEIEENNDWHRLERVFRKIKEISKEHKVKLMSNSDIVIDRNIFEK